jgi:kynureninase
VTWVRPSQTDQGVPLFSADDIAAAITADTDLVVFSRVFFTTAQILADHTKVVNAAHAHGALVVCDLFHAAGVIPLEMEKEGYDFAIGGSYKYLRGGPGACWLAIHPKTFDQGLRSLDTGWFAKSDHFGFQRQDASPVFKPRGDGWLESTPAVLLPYQARAGLEFALDIGVPQMRAFVLERLAKMRSVFKSQGIDLYSPSDPSRFGNFTLMPHRDADRLWKALLENGLNVDARQGFVRFGPDLLNTDEDFETAAKTVKSLL